MTNASLVIGHCYHASLACVVEQPARIDDRADLTERFERILFSSRGHSDSGLIEIYCHNVASL